jgi:hypothetical protein
MGAANALAAYKLYAGKIPQTSMSVLVYMALVALDRNEEPAWWEGHEMLAIRCYGYPEPVTDAGLRAVRRGITPLFAAGAITVIRHSSGRLGRVTTVRYRLWLTHPAPDGKRPVHNVSVGRKNDERRTKNGRAQDGNRPPKEKEEKEELDNDGPVAGTTVEGSPVAVPAPSQDHDEQRRSKHGETEQNGRAGWRICSRCDRYLDPHENGLCPDCKLTSRSVSQ